MCRNIKTLHNFVPPATPEEIHASALQYVRKLSGMTRPARANEAAFDRAVRDVEHATARLLDALHGGNPRTREEERRKARERGAKREAALRARLGA